MHRSAIRTGHLRRVLMRPVDRQTRTEHATLQPLRFKPDRDIGA